MIKLQSSPVKYNHFISFFHFKDISSIFFPKILSARISIPNNLESKAFNSLDASELFTAFLLRVNGTAWSGKRGAPLWGSSMPYHCTLARLHVTGITSLWSAYIGWPDPAGLWVLPGRLRPLDPYEPSIRELIQPPEVSVFLLVTFWSFPNLTYEEVIGKL